MTQNPAHSRSDDTAPGAASDDRRTSDEDILGGPEHALDFGGTAPGAPGETAPPGGAADPAARIAELEAEVARLNRDYLGALAEAQNAKRIADKRIQDNTRYAVSNLAKAILPVADNMERALAAAPAEAREADPNLKNLAIGVEMTAKELMSALGQYGVRRIEAAGQPFDPNMHQAMQEQENPDVPAGTVVQVFQEGYMIHDRLLRPAMVVVSRGGPKRTRGSAEGSGPAGDGDGGGDDGDGGGDGGGGRVDTSV